MYFCTIFLGEKREKKKKKRSKKKFAKNICKEVFVDFCYSCYFGRDWVAFLCKNLLPSLLPKNTE